MKYSRDILLQSIGTGLMPKYYFFWGHTQKKEGVTDKSCFSQWFKSPFLADGVIYATAEHWMMAKKALLFNDTVSCEKILNASSPGLAKQLGREVAGFNDATWKKHAYELVKEGNFHKFNSNKHLKEFLLKQVTLY